MIENIEIQNFKSIKNLRLEGFKRINLFIGKANAGKTSILEALHLFVSKNPEDIMENLEIRKMLVENDIFQGFFFDYDLQNKPLIQDDTKSLILSCEENATYTNVPINNLQNFVEVGSKGINEITLIYKQKKGETTICIKKNFLNPNQIQFVNSVNFQPSLECKETKIIINQPSEADFIDSSLSNEKALRENLNLAFSNKETKEKLKNACRNFSEEIEEIFFAENKMMVQKSTLKNAINLKLMGEGFKKYISIMASKLVGKKYILIDEIENRLHFESIELLIKEMLNPALEDIQFFITTHNIEFLEKLHSILEKNKDLLAVFNLYEDNNHRQVKAIRYSQEDFMFNIQNQNEIRD